jgi:hypothetical protein
MPSETFPIDLKALKPLKLDPKAPSLTDEQKAVLKHNIQLCRDAIVFFTALAGAKGLSGHTGGAYDTVPEVMIIRGFIDGGAPIVPIFSTKPAIASHAVPPLGARRRDARREAAALPRIQRSISPATPSAGTRRA